MEKKANIGWVNHRFRWRYMDEIEEFVNLRSDLQLDALPPDIREAYLEVTRCYSKLLDRLARE